MRITSNVCLLLAVAVVALGPQVGFADYKQISQNVVGAGGTANPDTFYTGNQPVKQFSINDAGVNYTLYDPTAGTPTGTKGIGTVSLVTTLSQVNYDGNPATNDALFTGGSFSFTFQFDPAGGTNFQTYTIGGPISGLWLKITATGPTSTITGEGLWTATTINLPGSGIWAPPNVYSALRSLTITVGQNLTGFNWLTQSAQGESLYNIYPDDNAVPEPVSLLLLAVGGLMIRRRRA